MNKKELQRAISRIRASDKLIKEVLTMKTEKKYVTIRGKLVKAVVVAAILVVFAATTALAAPVIYDAIISGRIETDGEICVEPTGAGDGQWNAYEVWVDVKMHEDAPNSLEQFYVPILDDCYVQRYGFVYKDKMSACYMWTNGKDNWEDEVRFWQIAGGTYDPQETQLIVRTRPGVTPEAKLVQLGHIQGYLVEDHGTYGSKHFLWSDEEYLFHLEVPDEYTDDDIAKVLQSVVEVKDILPYCVSMSPEDIKSIFG